MKKEKSLTRLYTPKYFKDIFLKYFNVNLELDVSGDAETKNICENLHIKYHKKFYFLITDI